MGALDSIADPQIAAVLALARGAVNAELGVTAIDGAYGFPVTLGMLPGTRHPLLAAYRQADEERQWTTSTRVTISTLRLDYFAPETPGDKSDDRWPLLRAVWRELVDVLCRGSHPAVSGGAEVLELAGVISVEDSSPPPAVRYLWPEPGSRTFPAFQGTIRIMHEEAPDLSAYPDVSALLANVNLVGLPEGEQPLVADLIEP